MDNELFELTDENAEALMQFLGGETAFEIESNNQIYDALGRTSKATLSSDFEQRALAAMGQAQMRREQQDPAVALGSVIARSRRKVGLAVDVLANRLDISPSLLETLESGQLTIRQFISYLAPPSVAGLLHEVNLHFQDFAELLMNMTAMGNRANGYPLGKIAYRQGRGGDDVDVSDVVAYLAAIESRIDGLNKSGS